MPKQARCAFCGETKLLDVHPTYIFCSVCGRRTVKGKPKVEVPVAGGGEEEGGYGWGV